MPFDLGGSVFTGINRRAYLKLRRHLGLAETKLELVDPMNPTKELKDRTTTTQ